MPLEPNSLGTETVDIGGLEEFLLGTEQTPGSPSPKLETIVKEPETILNIADIESQLASPIKEEPETPIIKTAVKDNEEPETPGVSDQNIWSELGKGLVDLGKLDDLEEGNKWDQNTFVEAIDTKIKTGAEELLSNLIEGIHNGEDLFKALFIDRVDPTQFLKLQNEVLDYSQVSLDTETNQERIISRYLEIQGNDPEQIQDFIDFYKDKGTLEVNAKKAQEKLVERTSQEQKNLIAQKEVENQKLESQKRQFWADLSKVTANAVKEKEIDGLPINDKVAKEVLDFTTNFKYKRKDNGQELTDFDVKLMN